MDRLAPFGCDVVVRTGPFINRGGRVVDLPPRGHKDSDSVRLIRFFTELQPRFAWAKAGDLKVTRMP